MAKTRRTFTPEFKAEAVGLVTEQGKSLAEVARDLDLGQSLLRAWKQALARGGDQAFPGKGNPPAWEEELRRLRAENKRLTMERDLLKKRRPSSPGNRHTAGSRPFANKSTAASGSDTIEWAPDPREPGPALRGIPPSSEQ